MPALLQPLLVHHSLELPLQFPLLLFHPALGALPLSLYCINPGFPINPDYPSPSTLHGSAHGLPSPCPLLWTSSSLEHLLAGW